MPFKLMGVMGKADNYFPNPGQHGGTVYGGIIVACPQWVFADSIGTCNIRTGNPSLAVPKGKNCILRSLRAWSITPKVSSLRINQWADYPDTPIPKLGIAVTNSASTEMVFGPRGVNIGDMPYVYSIGEINFEFIYSIE